MESGFVPESTNADTSSSDGAINKNHNDELGDFECNICFELAQDPIVTLCGHLYCWPCLYRWLHFHSQLQECPLCKALIQEDKLVPLYGRGKRGSDHRSTPIPDFDIPNRPSGSRPDTALHPPQPFVWTGLNLFSNLGFLGGFMPMATENVASTTVSAGLFPSFLGSWLSHFSEFPMYGVAHSHPPGFIDGYPGPLRGVRHWHAHVNGHGYWNHQWGASQRQGITLWNLLLVIGFLMLLTISWF